jgi:hypothetical protein
MSIQTDLSDEAMALRWGNILHEIPELWDALRKWEIENRLISVPGGFGVKSDWVSVQRLGDVTRIRIGHPRG